MTGNDVALAARAVVAVVLVASGVGKLLALRGTLSPGGPSDAKDVLAAVALPVYELVLAALLLVVDAAWPSWLALLTFAVFTGVLLRRIAVDDRRPCNCFGAASRTRELSTGALLRNTWFLALALVATGATALEEPTALLATAIVACGMLAVSAVLVVRT